MGIKESYILSAKALTAPDTCVPVRRAACVSGQENSGHRSPRRVTGGPATSKMIKDGS
jgi:hypothetical protein